MTYTDKDLRARDTIKTKHLIRLMSKGWVQVGIELIVPSTGRSRQ